MAESVKVIVRCRPLNARENGMKCNCVITMDSGKGSCSISNPNGENIPPKIFTFDGVYFMESSTETIYNDIAYPLVEGVTEGYNGTIFAYGQTGCGKSFSMQGILDPPSQRGIIPRAFDHIFETVSVRDRCQFLIHASYLEIYNEEIRDLLGNDTKAKLELKEHPEKGVYVAGLSLHPVHNVKDCKLIMDKGCKNRSVGATLMNADSSRSHSIFTIFMEMSNVDEAGEEHIRAGKLNLVDLAGSERQAKTGSTGDRLKEATKINLSLSALGNVISALVDGKSTHIPYRDSKLTRLLQDSLGGNTKTMMAACLSPADNNYSETLSTLRYANRAKNIKNKPKINEDPKDALLRQYQEEIAKLKAMLMGHVPISKEGELSFRGRSAAKVEETRQELENEKGSIRLEYERKMQKMQQEMELERSNRGKLQDDMNKLRSFYDTKLQDVDGQLSHLPPTQAVLDSKVERLEENLHARKMRAQCEQIEQHITLHGERLSPSVDYNVADVNFLKDTKILRPDLSKPVIQGVDGVQSLETKVDITDTSQDSVECVDEGSEHGSRRDMPLSVTLKQEEALQRLQVLQQQMVGGENLDNIELKEVHNNRIRHAEDERRKRLIRANRRLDDDGIMVAIYEDIQEEIKDQARAMREKEEQIESLQREIVDIQSEFEFDRIDYLDTIREQARHIKLLDSIIERIQPCLRRDCNFYNLDRVRSECVWNEESQRWTLPKIAINRVSLPSGTILPEQSVTKALKSPTGRGECETPDTECSDDKLKKNIRSAKDITSTYFSVKRQSNLVERSSDRPYGVEGSANGQISPSTAHDDHESGDMNYLNQELRAAKVHGQIIVDDGNKKPTRLHALPQLNPLGKRTKSTKVSFDSL